jgi:hypothetical protein
MADETTEAAVLDKDQQQKDQKASQDAPTKDSGDPGCMVKDEVLDKCPKPPADPNDDDAALDPELSKLQVEAAKGDALKPVIAEKLAYAQGKDTVRADIVNAYKKALSDGLQKAYADADDRFKAIAADLDRSPDGATSPLQAWIDRWLAADGKITAVFNTQRQKADRLRARGGPRECELAKATDEAKRSKQAYDDWKSPGQKIKAIVDSYKDKLPKLSCDIHDGDDYAIYQFWFEVAPLHLGLRKEAVRKSNAPGIDRLCAALGKYPARRRALTSATEREDGSLYLIDSDKLDDHREQVLGAWEDAAVNQVEKQVDYAARPDDAASLAKDLAKLVADEPTTIKSKLQAKS